MHIVSLGDNTQEMSNSVFSEKKKNKKKIYIINFLSAELAKKVVKVVVGKMLKCLSVCLFAGKKVLMIWIIFYYLSSVFLKFAMYVNKQSS